MDEHQYDDVLNEIKLLSKKVDGVIDIEKCYARKIGMKYFIDLHLTVNANITVREGHSIAHKLKDRIKNEMPEIADVLIHIEPNE